MQIELMSVSDEYDKGKYKARDIAYNREGKKSTRTLMVFKGTEELFEVLTSAKRGDILEIELEKVEKGDQTFYNWVSATKVENAGGSRGAASVSKGEEGHPAAARPAPYKASGGRDFETHDERAAKQVYIIRQSSLSNAIAFVEGRPAVERSLGSVLAIAQDFVDFVLTGETRESAEGEVEKVGSLVQPKPATPKAEVKAKKQADFDDDIPF